MTARTWRISPHSESPYTRLDYLAILANARITRGRLRIPCPAHGGTNPNLELKVAGDRISAVCYSQGCSYREIAQAIEAKYGISIGRSHHQEQNTFTRTERKPASPSNPQNLHSYALQLWHQSTAIPTSPEHPARTWLYARHLWRPELPLPHGVRWVGAKHLHRDYAGAGAIIALAAPPAAWLSAWPAPPKPQCVQLIFIAADGSPSPDRGLTKRTFASTLDAVIVLGVPHLEHSVAAVDVAEGLADGLALAARSQGPAVATLGTSGMTSEVIAGWLATSPVTRVWADRDQAKEGRAPPGQRYGRQLLRLVNDAGGNAEAVHAPTPHKDPAAAAAVMGFNDLDPSWTEYARTLAEMQPQWPRWEVARQATAMCARG